MLAHETESEREKTERRQREDKERRNRERDREGGRVDGLDGGIELTTLHFGEDVFEVC